MPTGVQVALILIASYLIGAIPFSVIVGRLFYRVDVRQHGSGNAGATNVYRVLGARAAVAVLVLDMLKGVVAACLALLWAPEQFGATGQDWVLIGASFAAVLGHTYSPYLRLAGGKGVATAAGALLILTPAAWPVLLLTFVVVIALSRMVSLGSVAIAIEFPILVVGFYGDRPALVTFSFVAAALVIWRHRSNIARIVRGEEAKITFNKSAGVDREGPR